MRKTAPLSRACSLACGAFWRAPRALPHVPAGTRRSLARPDGASARARSHAALTGALRGRSRACPLARGALWRVPTALLCMPARAPRSLTRRDGAHARASSHAALSGAAGQCFYSCPHARGAPGALSRVPARTWRSLVRPDGALVRARSHAALAGAAATALSCIPARTRRASQEFQEPEEFKELQESYEPHEPQDSRNHRNPKNPETSSGTQDSHEFQA